MNLLSKKVFLRSNFKSPFDKALNLSQEIKNVYRKDIEEINAPFVIEESGSETLLDLSAHKIFEITLTDDVEIYLNNPTPGEIYVIKTIQDATGGRQLLFAEAYFPGGANEPVLTVTTAGTVDIYIFIGVDYNKSTLISQHLNIS